MSEICAIATPAAVSAPPRAVLHLPPRTSIFQRLPKHPRVMHYNRLVAMALAVNVGWMVYGVTEASYWLVALTAALAIWPWLLLLRRVPTHSRADVVARGHRRARPRCDTGHRDNPAHQPPPVRRVAPLRKRASSAGRLRIPDGGVAGGGLDVSIVDAPPDHVWVPGIPTMGVANVRKPFTKVVAVATGIGVGPVLGHLLDTSVPSRLAWATKNPRRTYGDQLIDEIEAVHPDATFWDASAHGKPDVLQLAYSAYVEMFTPL